MTDPNTCTSCRYPILGRHALFARLADTPRQFSLCAACNQFVPMRRRPVALPPIPATTPCYYITDLDQEEGISLERVSKDRLRISLWTKHRLRLGTYTIPLRALNELMNVLAQAPGEEP